MKLFTIISGIVLILFGAYVYQTKINKLNFVKEKVDFLFPPSKLEKKINIG